MPQLVRGAVVHRMCGYIPGCHNVVVESRRDRMTLGVFQELI